jgi:MFS family permease
MSEGTGPVPGKVLRNVVLLAACQALAQSGNVLIITTTALAAKTIAGNDFSWSTLPVTLQHLGVMLSIFPAAMSSQHWGRLRGFRLGSLAGIVGGVVCASAIWLRSFPLLCFGGLLMGYAVANMQLYRFAVTELAPLEQRAKAISYVTSSGVVAGIVGPLLAGSTADLLLPYQFAASYLGLVVLHAGAFVLLGRIPFPAAKEHHGSSSQRPLSEIARQPVFIVAVLGGMSSFGVMSFLMTASPLAIMACGLPAHEPPITIFLHVMGMFVPAFFTGHLIVRFGVLRVMLAGIAILYVSVAFDIAGLEAWNFRIGMLLLGVGWNFLFVGATTLVTTAFTPAERGKATALNDFLVFGTTAASSLLAGILQEAWGWTMLNFVSLPLITVALGATLWLRLQHRPRAV